VAEVSSRGLAMLIVLLSLLGSYGVATGRDQLVPPAIGAKASDFSLRDINGRRVSLSGFKNKKATVLVFVGAECPIANLYIPTLIEMHERYAAKNVQFLAIYSNDQDTRADVLRHARERKIPFSVLKDIDQRAADAVGAHRTPEAFLLDSERIIRYRGRIDDQYGYNYRRSAPTQTELKDAIDELLADKPISKPETEVRGCVIGRTKKETTPKPTR
jgi:peroxiredoxin